jgi:Fimbrial assembly protein (PilN)
MASASQSPLIVEWSPDQVRILDPNSLKSSVYPSLASANHSGREAIIAVRRGSVLIRTFYVPNAPRPEVTKILEMQLTRSLPFAPGEYVFDFRVGEKLTPKGKVAVVGAIKTELLNRIYAEGERAGLRIRAVVPAALGAWQASRSLAQKDAAVVEILDDALNIDVVQDGELWYSRTVPVPTIGELIDTESVGDEVSRTFAIAEILPKAVIGPAIPGLSTDATLPREALSYLAEPNVVSRQLFSFELPSRVAARRQRQEQVRAGRAILASVIALGMVSYLAETQYQAMTSVETEAREVDQKVQAAAKEVKVALQAESEVAQDAKILDIAFRPGQTLGDVVTVISNSAPSDGWLTSLAVGRDRPMTLVGTAISDANVSQFVADLAKSPRFSEVKATSVNRAVIGKRIVTDFIIGGKTHGLLSFERRSLKGGAR